MAKLRGNHNTYTINHSYKTIGLYNKFFNTKKIFCVSCTLFFGLSYYYLLLTTFIILLNFVGVFFTFIGKCKTN